jgi:hypothetical protein
VFGDYPTEDEEKGTEKAPKAEAKDGKSNQDRREGKEEHAQRVREMRQERLREVLFRILVVLEYAKA